MTPPKLARAALGYPTGSTTVVTVRFNRGLELVGAIACVMGFGLTLPLVARAMYERPVDRTASVTFDHNQPTLPADGPRTRSAEEGTANLGLTPIIPTYDRTGMLWARTYLPDAKVFAGPRPAIMVLHGGGGMNSGYLEKARWWASNGYVATVVDSFGSRGIPENWLTFNQFGANMRAADVVATARYLRGIPSVDPKRIYLTGGSQGGWAALRALTAGAPWSDEATSTIAAGIAWYPVCDRSDPGAVPLGPFTRPVLFLQGTGDTATPPERCADLAVGADIRNVVFDGATHAFDFRAPPRVHVFWKYPERFDPVATARALAEAIMWTEGHVLP